MLSPPFALAQLPNFQRNVMEERSTVSGGKLRLPSMCRNESSARGEEEEQDRGKMFPRGRDATETQCNGRRFHGSAQNVHSFRTSTIEAPPRDATACMMSLDRAKSVILFSLISMCILPRTAILETMEAIMSSKQPQRSNLRNNSMSTTQRSNFHFRIVMNKISTPLFASQMHGKASVEEA